MGKAAQSVNFTDIKKSLRALINIAFALRLGKLIRATASLQDRLHVRITHKKSGAHMSVCPNKMLHRQMLCQSIESAAFETQCCEAMFMIN